MRILVADDHEVVCKGVAALLAGRAEWTVCAEAHNGRAAVEAARELRPDVVVMDLSMPDMNGLEAARRIIEENPGTEVLILTMHASEQLVRQVFSAGARGYLLKSDAGTDLVAAVETVAQHRPYFSPGVTDTVLRGYLSASGGAGAPVADNPITSREREIVQLVASGKSSKEIAALLRITVKTVETHRAHIMTKLDLKSVTDLVRYAIRNQIIDC